MDGQALCYKKLTKIYTALEEQKKRAEQVQSNSGPLVNSLRNLLEQLSACENVSFDKEPLSEMVDLKPKLRYKLIKSIEYLMKKLYDDLSTLKDISRKISDYRKTSFDVYTQHASQGTLSLEQTVCGSATCPSVAELLEWMTEIDSSYTELYEEKLEILENISYEEPLKSQEVLKRWTSLAPLSRNKGFKDQIAVFLANNNGS